MFKWSPENIPKAFSEPDMQLVNQIILLEDLARKQTCRRSLPVCFLEVVLI